MCDLILLKNVLKTFFRFFWSGNDELKINVYVVGEYLRLSDLQWPNKLPALKEELKAIKM